MNAETIARRIIDRLKGILKSCTLCPRKCMVDRTRGASGFCGLADDVALSHSLPHYGEEPPISGTRGAGTIFLSSCNLRCIYCQNYQLSHDISGKRIDVEELSGIMLALEKENCHNIEPVTPTPQIPQVMEALLIARQRDLRLPLVYNCGGYENPEVLRMLDGMVDIYLPDFKYGMENDALILSGVKDYAAHAIPSIKEMVRQVGVELCVGEGVAKRGMLIRHLVIPGFISNSLEVLGLIKKHISLSIPLSVMSQYTPIPSVKNHPHWGKRVTREEYELVINHALDMGFETIFTQDVDERSLAPDFSKDAPFNWARM
ncbi:MAG: radical SAM protein [Syntrophales bacterium]